MSPSHNLKLKAENITINGPHSSLSLRTYCFSNGFNYTQEAQKSIFKFVETLKRY